MQHSRPGKQHDAENLNDAKMALPATAMAQLLWSWLFQAVGQKLSARLHLAMHSQRILNNIWERSSPAQTKHPPCQTKVCHFSTEAVQAGVGGGQHHVAAAQILQQGPAEYQVASTEGSGRPAWCT